MQYDGLERLSKQTGVICFNILLQTLRFRNCKLLGSPYHFGWPMDRDEHLMKSFEHRTIASGSLTPRHGAYSGCGWTNDLQILKVAANILNKQSDS
jgi:hypothetical protein